MAASRPALVGSFVLGGLALAVAAILFLGGSQYFTKTTQAVIFFDGSIAGLDVGAPVTFRGVRVGAVKRIALRLSNGGDAKIPVTIELAPGQVTLDTATPKGGQVDVEQLVVSGLRAELNQQSFVTGQLRIDLDFRPTAPVPTTMFDISGLPLIPALPSDLERLRSTLSQLPVAELAKSTENALHAIEHLSESMDQRIGPILDNANHSMASAQQALDAARQAVVTLQGDASQTLKDADVLTVDARHQLDGRSADIQRLLATAQQVAQQADTLLVTVNALTSVRSPLRGDLEASVRDLAASASSLRGLTQAIERDPSTLLRGRGTP
jgi:paraquat-inducible protein B